MLVAAPEPNRAESTGNLADAEAQSQGAKRLAIERRDVDDPLSSAGRERADVLGRFMTQLEARRSADLAAFDRLTRAGIEAGFLAREIAGCVPALLNSLAE